MKKQNGYISLISVLIVGAVVLSMVISTAVLGINQAKEGLAVQNIAEAKTLAEACAEKALMELKNSLDYGGGETINLGNGQCTIETIANPGQETRIVKIKGVVNNFYQKLQINITDINPDMVISSWQEVSDY